MLTKGINRIVPDVYDSIPNVFTTFGILGTFVGIYFGLRTFDVSNINEGILALLEGLKTAFTTSIWGIILSFIFGKVSQVALRSAERKSSKQSSSKQPIDELGTLKVINKNLTQSRKDSNSNFQTLNTSLIGENDDSVSTQLVKLKNEFAKFNGSLQLQNETMLQVLQALGGDGETSLLTQIQKLRVEQRDTSEETKKNVKLIVDSMNENNLLISKKFDEFSDLLAKNNTEALVDVMKSATEAFNEQMSELIEKLVQENFKELNNSVQSLNTWQQENKEMILSLTEQFKTVSEDFKIASVSIKEITENTAKLTEDNSQLSRLIQELQKVLIDDTKFQEVITKLEGTIDTVKQNTESFDKTTNKLNDWIGKEHDFKQSVNILITRLKEIEKIKDINGEFWSNTKVQMEEGVSIIANSSTELRESLNSISEEFTEQLNQTLTSLDELIQRLIKHYTNIK